MNRSIYLLFITFFLLISIGCRYTAKKEGLKQIETLERHINKADSTFAFIDTTKLSTIKNSVEEKLTFIRYHQQDTLNKEEAITLTKLADTYKLCIKTNKDHSNVMNDLRYSRDQLKQLKEDISKFLISSDSVGIFIAQENNAIVRLQEGIEIIIKQHNTCIKDYETYSLVIIKMANELELQLNNEDPI